MTQPRRSRSPGRIIFSARAGLFPDRSRPLAHIASGAPSGQPASHRSSNLVTQAGRIRTSMRREQIQQLQAAPRCNAGFDPGMILRRSNQPEDCSFSARLRVQTERQWWVTEPSCRGRSGCSPLLSHIKASIAWRPLVGGGGASQAPQPKGRATARGLDARLRLQHHFMQAGDALVHQK